VGFVRFGSDAHDLAINVERHAKSNEGIEPAVSIAFSGLL
jgi:hypothetical protein